MQLSKLKVFFLLITTGIVIGLIIPIFPISAYFSSTGSSSSNTLTTGDWEPPVSTISGLAAYQTSGSFLINYTAADNMSGLTKVHLYYRKGATGSFTLFATNNYSGETSVSGSFNFVASQGEGTYQFYPQAQDQSLNSQNLPAAGFDQSTILDTTPPSTVLTVSNGIVVDEGIINGEFIGALSTGWNWTGAVSRLASESLDTDSDGLDDVTFNPPSGSDYMARIGHSENFDGELLEGNSVWDNRLTQIITRTNSFLSFYWRVISFDSGESPAVVVTANDTEILRVTGSDIDTFGYPNDSGWQRAFFDLSTLSDSLVEIKFSAGNTDSFNSGQSWLYLDQVTTGRPAINSTLANLQLTASDTNGITSISYSLNNGTNWTSISTSGSTTIPGTSLSAGVNQLLFYATDQAGNTEAAPSIPTQVIVDDDAPDPPASLVSDNISEHEINLEWLVPSDLGYFTRVASYHIRVSTTELTTNNFNTAGTLVPNPPAPASLNEIQSFTVSGLLSGTDYWLGISACDPVRNCSPPAITTGSTISEHDADPGDVVINELMWMGTNGNAGDEWLELRNMTDQDIDLSDWYLTKKDSGGSEVTMYTFSAGQTISAGGYLLISEYDEINSFLAVVPDIVIGAGNTDGSTFALANSNLQIKLYDPFDIEIDTADDGTGTPMAGLTTLNGSPVFHSMERNASPNDGTNTSSWHTTFADTAGYFDAGATTSKGTPGAQNLSQPELSLPSPPQPVLQPSISTSLQLKNDSVSPIATPSASINTLPSSVSPPDLLDKISPNPTISTSND